ncbi:MAG TPA: hypothetical protein VFK33_16935 [Bacillales bacterium]|nr:hypothetical protein [Bacillales bacterium]
MQLQDALYNWLSIKKVAEARPDDKAAEDTYAFFSEILEEDHHIEKTEVIKEKTFYTVYYWVDGEKADKQFPVALIDALLQSIEAEPRYNCQ